MGDNAKVSIIIWARGTNEVFFRDCVNSVAAQEYRDFELVLIDETPDERIRGIAQELFPHDGRLVYYRLKAHKGMSYALNVGIQRRSGSHVFFLSQHDRLSKDAVQRFVNELAAHPDADIVYSDRDEIVGMHRMNPAFLPDFNVELLRHTNYIGDNVLFSIAALRKVGTLKENLESASVYELLLRAAEKRLHVRHIPRLLYHMRVLGDMLPTAQMRHVMEQVYREHMTVVSAHLAHMEIPAKVQPDRSGDYWRIHYDGSGASTHRREYILVREKNVSIRQTHFTERMYGILQQKDVGMVGVRFEKGGFRIDNCGYIFDEHGLAYPACHNQPAIAKGYQNRAILPHDVSMVDPALCMIDRKALELAGGFDRRLKGRAMMLDACLKMRKLRRRIVFDPAVVARKHGNRSDNVSSEESNAILMDKWGTAIRGGDPYYNRNLPMGLQNYLLY